MLETSEGQPAGRRGSIVASALWHGRWLILGLAVLAGAAGYLLSSVQAVGYTADSRLILSRTQPFDPLESRSDLAPERFVADQVDVLTSDPVLQRAAGQLGSAGDAADLASHVHVSAQASSDVVDVSATAPTAAGAVARANAVVAAYRDFVRAQVQEAAGAAAAAAGDPGTVAEIRARAAAYGDGVAVFEAAQLPSAPSTPRPRRNGLLAAAFAALVASGAALWRRDRWTAEDAADLAGQVGAPLLGVVTSGAGRHGAWDRATALEMVVVALEHATRDRHGQVVVTGVDRRVDTAGLVLGLAEVAGPSRRVLVVDADVHGRSLFAASGVARPDEPLEGEWGGEPDRMVSRVPGPFRSSTTGVDLAWLGQGVLDPQADVAAASKNLRLVAEGHDLVLIHTGPLPSDPSALALVGEAASTVLVVDADRPDVVALAAARRLMALAGQECSGLIVVSGRGAPSPRHQQARPSTVHASHAAVLEDGAGVSS